MCSPHALHAADGLAIDFRERGIVLIRKVAAVLQPVRFRKRGQLLCGRGGARLLPIKRGGCRDESDEDRAEPGGHDRGTGGLPPSSSVRAPWRGMNFWTNAECLRIETLQR